MAETDLRPVLRPGADADVEAVVGLVREFADYEREPTSCLLTAAQLRAALFASRHSAGCPTSLPIGG